MNLLIVESKNDKHFVEAVIRHIHFDKSVYVDATPICRIDDFDCLNSLSLQRLTASIASMLANVRQQNIEKIGVLIDLDNDSVMTRLQMINDATNQAIEDIYGATFDRPIASTGQFSTIRIDAVTEVQIACYFTNVNGQGELETVLKNIKTQQSPYADCLNIWRDCLKESGNDISQKEFDKFWLNNYIRFDTCSKKDKTQAERKCSMSNFDYILENKTSIFDFENPILDDLKAFLRLFD